MDFGRQSLVAALGIVATIVVGVTFAAADHFFSENFRELFAQSLEYRPSPEETLVARAAQRMGYARCGHLDTLSQGHVVACDLDLYTLDSRLRMRRWGRLRPDGTVESVKGDLLTGLEGPESPQTADALLGLLRARRLTDLATELEEIIDGPGYTALGLGLTDLGNLVQWSGPAPAYLSADSLKGRSMWSALRLYWPAVDNTEGRELSVDCETRSVAVEPPVRARWTGQGLPPGRAIYAAGERIPLDDFAFPAAFTVGNIGGEFFSLEREWASNPCGGAQAPPDPEPDGEPGDLEPDFSSRVCERARELYELACSERP